LAAFEDIAFGLHILEDDKDSDADNVAEILLVDLQV